MLDNDFDQDGDALSIVIYEVLTPAIGGELTCDSKRCWYDAPGDWDGSAFMFSYTIDDGKGATARALVTVTGL